jgi:hypothetical protein
VALKENIFCKANNQELAQDTEVAFDSSERAFRQRCLLFNTKTRDHFQLKTECS